VIQQLLLWSTKMEQGASIWSIGVLGGDLGTIYLETNLKNMTQHLEEGMFFRQVSWMMLMQAISSIVYLHGSKKQHKICEDFMSKNITLKGKIPKQRCTSVVAHCMYQTASKSMLVAPDMMHF
jgi:hypothetical protein